MIDFEDVVKIQEETQYNEIRQSSRSVRDKMRALRDEFGFQPTEPQKVQDEDDN